MLKHKLYELNKFIGKRMGSLKEEIKIVIDMKLNPLYVIDLTDEMESLRWVTRIIKWVLHRAINGHQRLGVTRMRLELEGAKKFENMLHEKIQELEIELEHSIIAREKEVLIIVIATPGCVVGRDIEIIEANNNFQDVHLIVFSYNYPKFWQ
ncbi:MAG TPA: hypothetical protein VE548_06320 [Nitrososphaeraceae archaeon]|nr:hypothetical protein [Nitrososphaeraceae archaeon]